MFVVLVCDFRLKPRQQRAAAWGDVVALATQMEEQGDGEEADDGKQSCPHAKT